MTKLNIEKNGVLDIQESDIYTHIDGSKWLLIFEQDVSDGNVASDTNVLFTMVECLECKNQRSLGKFSRMNDLSNFIGSDNKYEFLLLYPFGDNAHLGRQEIEYFPYYDRWKQTDRPQDLYCLTTSTRGSVVPGFEAIDLYTSKTITGDSRFGGLSKHNNNLTSNAQTFLQGLYGYTNYFYALGVPTLWNGGLPCLGNSNSYALCHKLYVRIDTMKNTAIKDQILGYNTLRERFVKLPWITADGYEEALWYCVYDYDYRRSGKYWTSVSQAKRNQVPYMFSDLGSISKFKGSDNKVTLLLEYPERRRAGNVNGYGIWKQTNSPCDEVLPITGATMTGYQAIQVPFTLVNWKGGLGVYHNQSGTGDITKDSYIVGSGVENNWYYAIAPKSAWSGGYPGPDSSVIYETRLYVRVDDTTYGQSLLNHTDVDRVYGSLIANEFTEI